VRRSSRCSGAELQPVTAMPSSSLTATRGRAYASCWMAEAAEPWHATHHRGRWPSSSMTLPSSMAVTQMFESLPTETRCVPLPSAGRQRAMSATHASLSRLPRGSRRRITLDGCMALPDRLACCSVEGDHKDGPIESKQRVEFSGGGRVEERSLQVALRHATAAARADPAASSSSSSSKV